MRDQEISSGSTVRFIMIFKMMEILEKLSDLGIDILRNDLDGTIEFTF